MSIPVFPHGRIAVLAYGIGLAGIFLAANTERAFALTPSSPEVKESIDKAIAFLKSEAANDERVGAMALQGYALLSYGTVDHSHIKITAAAARIQSLLTERDPAKVNTGVWDIYSTGLSIIFLVKLDPKKYHDEVTCLLTYLRWRQKPHGGWGYVEKPTGDTSMTQYGVLSSWTARKAGFNVPQESIEAVAGWLLKTQDPSGAFGYQGNIAEGNGLVAQQELRPSMTAAGSGSLYICADYLGLIPDKEKDKDDKLPSALKEVKGKEKEKDRIKTRIDPRAVHDTEARAKQWMDKHTKISDAQMWVHYYLYALERCMTFRYLYEHASKAETAEPEWYNDGADFLMKSQDKNGSWCSNCGAVSDTAFSVLFLMRNTRRVLVPTKPYGEGIAVVGHGIAPDTDRIERDPHGNIVASPLRESGEALIKMLENPDSTREFDSSVERLAQLPSDEVESLVSRYGDKIRKLVGNKSPEARLAAVKTLAKARDLGNVETLIYALSDPDYRVVRAANDGLLRIRRAPTNDVLPDNFSEKDRRLLVERWKAWYQTIRPSTEVKH